MKFNLILVGKLKDHALQSRCDEFAKWLTPYAKLKITELPDSTVEKEGAAILKACGKTPGFLIVLTEEGRQFTSREFAALLGATDTQITLVIGGPYGLAPQVKAAANLLWSLSKLTFTHELARLLLFEQLFRAGNILSGGKYHND